MRKIYYTFSAIVFLTINSLAQSFDPALSAQLQNTLDSIKLADNIQGISAAVIYPGQGLWTGVSGESHSGVPITPDMEFHIASNTKTFTAVLLLKLVENNLVSLDDSLHEWLPSYNSNIDPNITVRQLLNHTSGIANTFDIPGYTDSLSADRSRIFTQAETLSWLPAPMFTPGMGQYYSNPNIHLAGLIVESATGHDFEQMLNDSIFSPLGLDSTFFPIYDTIQGEIAHPWQNGVDWSDTVRTSIITANWSAGAIYSTANEMAQWYNELFNNNFLAPSVFNEMTTIVGPQKRGLGIQQINIENREVWGHGGGTVGYSSSMVFDTTSHAVIAVLVNDAPANPLDIAEVLLETLINNNPVSSVNNEIKKREIVIYPNPTTNMVNLNIDQQNIEVVYVYDINGKLVKTTYSNYFSIADLISGQYFLKIETDKQKFDQIIIKH